MSKGTKTASDAPALLMIVTGRGLEPATAYDEERLNSYRRGAEIWVHPTQEINVALRKFWAVLGKVVKDCKTPWKNTTQAADDLKLALGHTNQFKDHNGNWKRTPRSLTEFSLPEMEAFNLLVWDVLFKVTGVDPITMQAEAPMHDAAQTPLEPEADSVDAKTDNTDASETVNQSTGEITERTNQPDPVEVERLIRECAVKLWGIVTSGNTPQQKRDSIEMVIPAWKNALPTRLDVVRNIIQISDKVVTGKIEIAAGRSMIAGFAGIKEEDL